MVCTRRSNGGAAATLHPRRYNTPFPYVDLFPGGMDGYMVGMESRNHAQPERTPGS
jgi:hypothetical protein